MSTPSADLRSQVLVSPVLVGRSAVLGALQRLVDEAQRGASRMVLIGGQAGIGKSRLAAEVRRHAVERGFVALQGACFPQDRTCPYAPVVDLIRASFARQSREATAHALGPYASDLFPLLPDLVPRPVQESGAPHAAPDRRRLFAVLADCLAAQAGRAPLLLMVEDLHWGDDASLDFLLWLARSLARRPADTPLLVLGTYRAEEGDARLRPWLAQLDRERLAIDIVLNPLSREEVDAMLAALVGQEQPLPREAAEAIVTLAEGNPFCVEELLRSLIASGDHPRANDSLAPPADVAATWQVPRSVQDAVQQRAAQLSPAARRVLTLAAVVGRRFDFSLLKDVAQVDESTLLRLVKELVASHLVVEASHDQFSFRHALTRQAIYGELLARERVALHRAVAESAERIYASSEERRLDDLAYHFAEAGVWDKALTYAQRAGERALRVYAPRAAVEVLTRGLVAAEHLLRTAVAPGARPREGTRAAMHRQRGRAYEMLGDLARAQVDYETAVDLARAAHDRRAEWVALVDLGLLWSSRDYAQAGGYYQRVLELARALDDPALVAHSLNRLGNWQANAAQPRDALPLHDEALAIFERLHDAHGTAVTLDLLGTASYLSGDLPGSMRQFERAAALFRDLDDRQGLVMALAMLASRAGGYELNSLMSNPTEATQAVRDGETALDLARRIAWRAGEAFALAQLAATLGYQGVYRPALDYAQRSLASAQEISHPQWSVAAHCALGQIYLDVYAFPEAVQHLEKAIALGRELGSLFWRQIASGWLAWAHVQRGAPEQASALLGEPPRGDAGALSLGAWWVLFARAQMLLALAQPEQALHLIAGLAAPAAEKPNAAEMPRLALLRGETLAALRRWEEAEGALLTAHEGLRRRGIRPDLWRSHVALGTLYHVQRRDEEAQREFSAAVVEVESLATAVPENFRQQFLRQAFARLPRPYRPPLRRGVAREGKLTAREAEVAALLSRGKTNREIAETLVIGERTVETHVANILAKLGGSSRRDIADWAAETGLLRNTS